MLPIRLNGELDGGSDGEKIATLPDDAAMPVRWLTAEENGVVAAGDGLHPGHAADVLPR